ncbi:mitogen-activated protein kinase binding protein 1 [Mactra antiquata]
MDNKQNRKILKSPVAKRRSRLVPKDQKVTLERVLGLTATSNATLTCDPNTGLIAYPAGYRRVTVKCINCQCFTLTCYSLLSFSKVSDELDLNLNGKA